ncbi:zinc carboxypeptidase [Polaribacter vadi]|uniref:M14 family metallopeptidase n=1 Tax=Polaribacter TaxID=52959 RepID=UPI001C096F2B|nr:MULTISPECIES: M14 family metallopeptidase [Polaribacter]MBU3009993.1 zinc carboxypeptidase [Polaribacter vadi]MDO6739800.1 M14 family metallopeptidase [Polaribacter sp. 1_MG-2023]
MKIKALLIISIFSFCTLFSQEIKSPQEYLGYEIGSRFTRHHKVVDYFKYVSNTLKNVQLEKYGETNEHRPLYVTYISSQENIANLETIRKANLSQTGILKANTENKKAIVWLSYNVHGNEASSTEASMLTLYELVTTKKAWLENTVVIIDPCINPDGRDRYVNWYNQVQNSPYNSSQDSKEHHEPWPGGRPNHYLFDLNRDWAWATQVETQQRLKVYNKWLPHVHVDFHEQGINSPYYFAPAAKPYHEDITDWQIDFQTQIGKNHASYFDKNNWMYFTKESFDLLYPSYGDTYPTFMGAIGMTYEQAGHGRAGLGIDNDEGIELTLIDRAQHHHTTGLSTVEISSKNAEKLNTEFTKFFADKSFKYKSYVLKNENSDKTQRLINLLDKHEITYEFANSGKVKGYNYATLKEESLNVTTSDLVIHTNQPKGRMVKVLFEPQTKILDSLTYDSTAWALPYAHGFNAVASENTVSTSKKEMNNSVLNTVNTSSYAYISKWNSIDDATFLAQLLNADIKVRFSEKDFSLEGKDYQKGSLIILRHDNLKNEKFDTNVVAIANKLARKVTPVSTGFVDSGKDFGSGNVKPIFKQRVALLSGSGTSSLSFGQIWHYFETELKYPVSILDTDYFSRVDFSNYDVIILPDGYYSRVLNKSTLDKLKSWVRSGGTLIALKNALSSFADKDGFSLKSKKNKEDKDKADKANLIPYEDLERESTNNIIIGAIFNSKVDASHPLAFGYSNSYFSLKSSSRSYEYLKNGGNVAYFTKDAKNVAGFAGIKALENVPESLLFGEDQMGRGSIIYMVDNPLFRAFWENGKLFFANAIFLRNSSHF